MYSALSAFMRMVHPVVTTVRDGVNWGTSDFRSVSAENVTSRYLKDHVKSGRAGKVGVRGRHSWQTVGRHVPVNSLPDYDRDVGCFNNMTFSRPGLNAATQEIELSSVINRTRPLLGITQNARDRYAELTGKKAYLSLNFKRGDVFLRSGPLCPEKQFLSPAFRVDNNNMSRADRCKKTREINRITRQVDYYLSKATTCPEDAIYKQVYVKQVEKALDLPEGHGLLEIGQLGLYAAEYMKRGTLLCHFGGVLDFYESNSPYEALRNAYCLEMDVSAMHISDKRQSMNIHSKILVTSYDRQHNWVGNAGGRINDPRGTKGQSNVAIQWVTVFAQHSPSLTVDMPFLITTEEVVRGQQLYFDYGTRFFEGSNEVEVSPTALETCLSPEGYRCGDCGGEQFHRTLTINKMDFEEPFLCCAGIECDSEVFIRI